MRRVCERLRTDLRSDFNVLGAHRLYCECGVCATVFGMVRVWISILLRPLPIALLMWRVCDRIRADSRLSFNFVGAATACIVNAVRVQPSSG